MNEKEISSLIRLLDDPDTEVFAHVEEKLATLGPAVVTLLENRWEQSFDALEQNRIENLIYKIQFRQVEEDLEQWIKGGYSDLLEGLLIINRYQYPALDEQKVKDQLQHLYEQIENHRSFEVEPADHVMLINHILYEKLGFSGNTSNYHDPQNSFIGQVLENRKGNPLLLACIYLLVAQKMGLPIFGINLPKHFILAYASQPGQLLMMSEDVLFYINAFNGGQMIGRQDVISYLKQLDLSLDDRYLLPCTNLDIITRVLHNLSTAYSNVGSEQKLKDIEYLLQIVRQGQGQ